MSDKTDAAAPAAGTDSAPAAKEFDPVRVKALRIKTGVVKRTGKEKVMYRREADKEKEKIEKMKAEGKDDADIKKMTEVMQESLMMIPDSHRRLEKAYAELKALVDAEEAEMAEAKEFQEAKTVLAEADEQLKAS